MASTDANPFADPNFGKQGADENPFSNPDFGKPSGAIRRIADQGIKLAQGVVGVPEAAVGVADLVTGGRAGKLAESAGVRFKDAKAIMGEYLSPEQKAADQEVAQAEGFLPTVGAMVRNPSTIVGSVMESAPSMIGGGAAARGLLKVAPKIGAIAAGAAGEGLVSAGQNAEQVRQEDPNGLLTPEQSAILAASGALTGGISLASGKLANKLGIGDVQTMLASGKLGPVGQDAAKTAAGKGMARKLAEGVANEGVLQELPQSYQEQVSQNLAQGKPWDEGAAKAAAQGMLAGAVMGGGANVASHFAEKAPEPVPAAQTQPDTQPGSLELTPPSGPTPQLGYSPLAGTPTVFPDGSVALNGEQEFARRYAPQKPSEAMGLDPAAGPLSAAAVTAVDTGAHQEIQLQQANEADQAAYEQATAEQDRQAAELDTATKPITHGPIAEAAMSDEDKRAVLFSNQAVADGGIQYPGTLDGDILNGQLRPYKRWEEAIRRVKMEGKDWRVAKVQDGFVARRKNANGPSTEIQPGDTGSAGVRSTDSPASMGVGATDGNGVGAQSGRSPDAVLDQAGQLPKRTDAAPVGKIRNDLRPEDVAPNTNWVEDEGKRKSLLQGMIAGIEQGKTYQELGIGFGSDDHELTVTHNGKAIVWLGDKATGQAMKSGQMNPDFLLGNLKRLLKLHFKADPVLEDKSWPKKLPPKDVTRVQNAAPRADTTPAAQAVEAPAVVESNAAAPEGVSNAGSAKVESGGVARQEVPALAENSVQDKSRTNQGQTPHIVEASSGIDGEYNFAEYGEVMTMRQALTRVKELDAQARSAKKRSANASTKSMQAIDDNTATNASSLARKLRKDIEYQRTSFPQARADFESQVSQPQEQVTVKRSKNGYAEVKLNGKKHFVTPFDDHFVIRNPLGAIAKSDNEPLQFASEADAIAYAANTTKPQEQPNAQAAKAIESTPKPEAGTDSSIPKPAASDGVAAASEAGKPAEPVAPKSLREVVDRNRAEKAKPVEPPAEQPSPVEASSSRPDEPSAEQIKSVKDITLTTKVGDSVVKKTSNASKAMKALNERADALEMVRKCLA